jgi:DNA polymerase I-like protein with 3'-5' exonuclease and polymerase domains
MEPYSDRLPPNVEAYGAKYQSTIEQAWEARKLAIVDTETNGLGGFPWAIGILTRDGDPETYVQQTEADPHTHVAQAASRVRQLIKQGYVFVFHNAKYDVPILGGVGIHIQWGQVLDTQLLAYCWDSSVPSLSLDALTGEKLDYRQSLIDAGLLGPRTKKGTEYTLPPWLSGVGPLMTQYLIGDLLATAKLCARLLSSLRSADPKAWWHFTRIEAPFTRIIVGMEHHGFGFDYLGAGSLVSRWETERAEVLGRAQAMVGLVPGAEKLYAKGSHKRGGVVTYDHCALDLFNPNSVPHKIAAFTRLGWVPSKRTAKGAPSVDDEVLKELAKGEGAAAELAQVLREASKLTKYIGMVTGYMAKAEDTGTHHVLRGEFNQTVTRTGRLSSSNP